MSATHGMYANVFVIIVGLMVLPGSAVAANLFLAPSSGEYEVGERIQVQALVSGDASLNAASGIVSVSGGVSIESISKASSILNFWITEPSFTPQEARFEGVSLSGFQGPRGLLVTVTLKAVAPGGASVSWSGGQVLANDGEGTDVTGSKSGAQFVIVPATRDPQPPTKTQVPAKPQPKVEMPVPGISVVARDAPSILLGSKNGSPAILGTTGSPQSEVVVRFVSFDGSTVYIVGEADGLGAFALPVPRSLLSGSYTAVAHTVFDDGSRSEASNAVTVEIGTLVYGSFSWRAAALMLLGVLLLLAAILAMILVRRHVHGDLSPIAVRRKVRDAERVVEKSFTLLREDMVVHGKTHKRRNVAGSTIDIEQDLDDAQSAIESSLKSIGEHKK